MKIKICLVEIALIFLTGCSTVSYKVSVDAFSSKAPHGKRYVIVPLNTDDTNVNKKFEFASYIHGILEKHGYSPVDHIDDAGIIISFFYKISKPMEKPYSYTTPIYGQTGISSSRTSGYVSSGGYYSGTTTHTPRYGVVGSQQHSGTATVYGRFLKIEAFTFGHDDEKISRWETTLFSTGTSGDMRRVFPVLMAAADEFIGTSPGRKIDVILKETSRAVKDVKSKAFTPLRGEKHYTFQ